MNQDPSNKLSEAERSGEGLVADREEDNFEIAIQDDSKDRQEQEAPNQESPPSTTSNHIIEQALLQTASTPLKVHTYRLATTYPNMIS